MTDGCGIYLEELSIEEISLKIKRVLEMDEEEIKTQISSLQSSALEKYSRSQYSKEMKSLLKVSL